MRKLLSMMAMMICGLEVSIFRVVVSTIENITMAQYSTCRRAFLDAERPPGDTLNPADA
jgi:hypothetical protein